MWLRLLISAGLMAVLLGFMVDLPAAWQAIARSRWEYFAWLAVWITIDRLVMTYKWRLLLVCRGLDIGIWESLKAYYIASFAGCFLPSTVGGDAMRVAAVSGPKRPSDLVAASVVLERALGFLAAALAAGLALVLLAGLKVELPRRVLWLSLVALAVAGVAVVASLSGWLGAKLERLVERMASRSKVLAWIARFLKAYNEYRQHRGTLITFLILSVAEQSVPVVGTWLTALAFQIDLSLLQAIVIAPLAHLFMRIPVSVSGFGVAEGLYVAFFSLIGLRPTDSFMLGLVANLSIVVTTLPGAFFYARGGLHARRRSEGGDVRSVPPPLQ
jgi:uncharacterized protein (TIRG00374 family)